MKATVLVILFTAGLCAEPTAFAADSLTDRLRHCAGESDDAKRLACYDLQIGRSKSGTNEDIGVTGELLRRKQQAAGLPPPPPPQDLHAQVVRIDRPPQGKFIVTLDNGQVWQQQDDTDLLLQAGDAVTIRRGALGSLWLANAKHKAQARVQRVK